MLIDEIRDLNPRWCKVQFDPSTKETHERCVLSIDRNMVMVADPNGLIEGVKPEDITEAW